MQNTRESDSSRSSENENPSEEEKGNTDTRTEAVGVNNESTSCSVEIVDTSMEQANIMSKKSKLTQTKKAKVRSIGTQTHLTALSTFVQPTAKPLPSVELQQEVQTNGNTDVNIRDNTITVPAVSSPRKDDHTDSYDFADENAGPVVEINHDGHDEDFIPPASSSETEDSDNEENNQGCVNQVLSTGKPASEQMKIVVFEEAIINAFATCRQCGSQCTVYLERQIGSSCNIRVSCLADSSHDFTWSTGPIVNRMAIFHLLFASGILCTGLEATKVLRLFDALKIMNIKQRELSNILKAYVIPAVFQVWQREQRSRLDVIKGKAVTIGSDMRVDSPGHCGLLGSGSTL